MAGSHRSEADSDPGTGARMEKATLSVSAIRKPGNVTEDIHPVLIGFEVLGLVFVFLINGIQGILPLNPQGVDP